MLGQTDKDQIKGKLDPEVEIIGLIHVVQHVAILHLLILTLHKHPI